MTATRTLLACAAALLDQGRTVDRLSRPLTAAALIGVLVYPAAIGQPPLALAAAAIVVALAGFAESYLAIRTAFDAALFHRLASAPEPVDFGEIDQALTKLGLLPAAKRGCAADARIAGARRLMRLQVLALLVQVFAIAGGAMALMWR
ncbi:MAG: hypothetical protein WD929_02115 [Steroidobacteraceae bacterium]